MPPTIAPVLLLLPPPELAPTDGVTRMVDWMVVVITWPSAPVETSTDVNTEVDVLVGVGLKVSSVTAVFPFSTDVIVLTRGVVVGVAAGWVVGDVCGGVVDC
jgi:hypothetical protein